jgi:hypothetical protein
MDTGLLMLKLEPTLLCKYNDGNFETLCFGITPNEKTQLPDGYTHFGIVVSGVIHIAQKKRIRRIQAGDFFSVAGKATIYSHGTGIVSSAHNYEGFNVFGGPLEEKGKLRYIDGCTDTLLVPPVRKGDPCLNHLHFPPNTVQTPHTHPSVRINIVYRGSGVCLVPNEKERTVPLIPGYAFIMKTETLHSFNTNDKSMDVITFHPDSDTGMTDDDHPMVNRTIVNGISANVLDDIRTRES